MTQVIDERVVEMKFDNEEFEKNVAQSMSTLQKLKNALNFDSAKPLAELGSVTKNFDMGNVATTVENVSSKFSALEVIGVTALVKITNAAMDMGTKLVKSLTLDQVTAGFTKYADKTTAVQTIMAATANQFADQGTQMAYINEQMDKLMWFTDETSYNFVDMVSNIGKFTSNNIDLATSVTAMEGIANWAAISGQNATTASRAMYNFAQAMGVGAMKVQDWKSIENANMATYQFKQTAIETAAELGKLKKVADGVYETLDGKGTVTAESFRDELKRGWFDKDVMLKTLEVYGGFTDKLHDLADQSGLTATQLLDASEKIAKGEEIDAAIFEESAMSAEELTAALTELNGEQFKTGQQAFRNAQEAKTFIEVIDALKDAVSTKWSQTFEYIFGNYLEAKKLWTGLVNDLYNVFAAGGDTRNEILGFWRELGGREEFLEGVINMLNLIVKPLQTIHQAFTSMFPDAKEMGHIIYDLSVRFKEFFADLQPSNEALRDIYVIFKSIFTIGKLVASIFVNIIHAILPVTSPMKSLLEIVIHFVAIIAAYIQLAAEFVMENNLMAGAIGIVVNAFKTLLNVIKTVATIVGGGLFAGIAAIVTALSKGGSAIKNFFLNAKPLERALDGINKAMSKLSSLFSVFTGKTEKANTKVVKMQKNYAAANEVIAQSGVLTRETTKEVKKSTTVLEKVANVVKTVVTVVGAAIVVVITAFKKLGTTVIDFFKNIDKYWTKLKQGVSNIGNKVKEFFGNIGTFFEEFKARIVELLESLGVNTDEVKAGFEAIGGAISNFISSITPGKVVALAFAASLIGIAGAAVKLSGSITDLAGAAKGLLYNINKLVNKQFAKASVFTDIAKAFALISVSLIALAVADKQYGPNFDHVVKFMLELMGLAGGLAIAMTFISSSIAKKGLVDGFRTNVTMMIAMAGAIALLSIAIGALSQVTLKGNWKEWAGKLGVLALLLAEMVATVYVLSKVAPVMSKGSILLVTLALAFKYIADALVDLAGIDLTNIQENIWQFALIFVGIAAMVAAAGQLKLTSALSIILVAKAIKLIIPELKEIAKLFDEARFDQMVSNFEKHALGVELLTGVMIGMAALIWALGNLGKLIAGIGAAAVGIAAGVAILIRCIGKIKELINVMTAEEWNTATNTIIKFVAVLSAVILIIDIVDKIGQVVSKRFFKVDLLPMKFATIGVAMLALGASMLLMVSALDMLASIKQPTEKLRELAHMLEGLVLVFGITIALTGLAARAKGVAAIIISTVVSIGIIIGELAVLAWLIEENPDEMFRAIATLTIIFTELAALFVSMGRIGYKKTGPILALSGLLITLTGVTVLLADFAAKDTSHSLRTALITLGILVAGMVGLTHWLMSLTRFNASKARVRKVLGVFTDVIMSTVLIVGELLVLGSFPDKEGLIVSAVAIGSLLAIFVRMTSILYNLTKLNVTSAQVKHILSVFYSVIAASLAIMIELTALSVVGLKGGGSYLLEAAALITAMLGLFVHMTRVLAKLAQTSLSKPNLTKVLMCFIAVVSASVLLSIELGVLSNFIDETKIIYAAGCLAALLAEFVGLTHWLVEIAKVKLNKTQLLTTLSLLAGVVVASIPIAIELVQLSKISVEDLGQASICLGGLLAAITVLTGVLAFVASSATMDLKAVGLTLLLMAGVIGEVYTIGLAIAKIGTVPIAQIEAAKSAIIEITAVVDAIVILMGVLGAVAVMTGVGAAGIVLGLIAFITAIAGIAVVSDSIAKVAPALDQLTSSLERFQNLNFAAISAGFSAIGDSYGSLTSFANALKSVGPNLNYLNELIDSLNSLGTTGSSGSNLSSIVKDADGSIVTITEHTKEAEKSWGELNDTMAETGTITKEIKDEVPPLISDIDKTIVNGAKDTGKKAANSFTSTFDSTLDFWKSGKVKEGVKTFSIENMLGLSDEQKFAKNHPIVNSILESFTSADNQVLANKTGKVFGDVIGDGIVQGILEKVEAIVPGIQGIFSGIAGASDFIAYKETNPLLVEAEKNYDKLTLATERNTMTTSRGITARLEMASATSLYTTESKKAIDITGTLDKAAGKVADTFKDNGMKIGDYVTKIVDGAKDAQEAITNASDGAASGVEGATGKAGKALKDFASTLKDTLSGQMDIFSKFEFKTGISADTMLENMRSQLDGFASWSHRLAVLAERGINQALYQKLAEMGPKGYETLNAFVQMTDEQLQEANKLFTASLVMPDKAANVVSQGYAYAGEMAALGWSNALQEHMAEHAASMQAAKKEVADFNAGLGVASPSTEFFQSAIFCLAGFKMGITDEPYLAVVMGAIKWVTCFRILETFKTELHYDVFYSIGVNAMAGLTAGLEEEGENAVSTAESIVSRINEAIEGRKGFDNGSPSKRLRQDGIFAMRGLTIGITEAGENVIKAAQEVTDGTLDTMNPLGRLQDLINTSMDFNPIITPMLDLSYIRSQVSSLDAMLNDPNVGIGIGQNGGNVGGTNINFTQNNYSPKSLSRIEIYRQTKNQISMMKGAVAR